MEVYAQIQIFQGDISLRVMVALRANQSSNKDNTGGVQLSAIIKNDILHNLNPVIS